MGRLALVTGGSRGIGAAVVALLRGRGWDVLAPTRAELDFSTDGGVVEAAMENLQLRERSFDSVIFCHGEWFSRSVAYGFHFWRQYRMRVVNPWHVLSTIELNAGASIVIVSSTQAFGGRAETLPYAAACAAQVRMALGLAQSMTGIRVNAVCPGLTATSMGAAVRASGDCRPDAVAQPPQAVAGVIVGLVEGDENGAVVRVVDGVATRARWVWE